MKGVLRDAGYKSFTYGHYKHEFLSRVFQKTFLIDLINNVLLKNWRDMEKQSEECKKERSKYEKIE